MAPEKENRPLQELYDEPNIERMKELLTQWRKELDSNIPYFHQINCMTGRRSIRNDKGPPDTLWQKLQEYATNNLSASERFLCRIIVRNNLQKLYRQLKPVYRIMKALRKKLPLVEPGVSVDNLLARALIDRYLHSILWEASTRAGDFRDSEI